MASSLPYTLSAEEATLFAQLQDSALMYELVTPGEGELVELYKQKKREQQKKRVLPYADLLADELMYMLQKRKDQIMAQLRESNDTEFMVDLFSWKAVHYHESLDRLKKREADMTPTELHDHLRKKHDEKELIKANGWESTFGADEHGFNGWAEETTTIYEPMKVDRIFKDSDLALRLSLFLGPNFSTSIRWDNALPGESYIDSVMRGFSVYKKTLYVNYHPFGLPKKQLIKLLAVAKEDKRRQAMGEKIRLRSGEYPVGHEALDIVAPAPVWGGEDLSMPSLIAPHRNECFCGCTDGGSE